MRALIRVALLGCALLLGCRGPGRPAAAPGDAPQRAAGPLDAPRLDASCGLRPTDWCPAPPGDPCGAHTDTASCRADPRCAGLPYRGESVIVCHFDERGFADNCPTVGCVLREGAR